MKIAVRFLQPHRPYNAGEVAGFDEVRATELIAKGVAVRVEPERRERPAKVERPPTRVVNGVEVPSVEEVLAAGYPSDAAERIIARQLALAEEAGRRQEPSQPSVAEAPQSEPHTGAPGEAAGIEGAKGEQGANPETDNAAESEAAEGSDPEPKLTRKQPRAARRAASNE